MSGPVETIVQPVTLSYEQLNDPSADLNQQIEAGFGYSGLGLIIVTGVPNLLQLRKDLLPLGSALARLSDAEKAKIESPETFYSVGWSHGKEKLKEGVFDVNKGSMYANPQYDIPANTGDAVADEELVKKYPQDYHPNIWPKESLPTLEHSFKALGQLMISVGTLLAAHCDKYVESHLGAAYRHKLAPIIKGSRTAKGRLLHYFPVETDQERTYDSWCTWHNDHSALTALCSAYFTKLDDPDLVEVRSPDPASGLYASTRLDQIVKIAIPADCLAFQIGETSQVLTGGILRATPHAVRAPKYPESVSVQRDTFAVFMQPNFDQPMQPPDGSDETKVAVGKWRPGQTYSQFSKGTIEGYY